MGVTVVEVEERVDLEWEDLPEDSRLNYYATRSNSKPLPANRDMVHGATLIQQRLATDRHRLRSSFL